VGDNEYLLNDPVANPPALNILNINPANPESAPVIRQGALEVSNVDPNQEMSQLVVQQRAFQLNSRAIAISDQMMGIANSLRSR
jgi:flagellar basal-body rod protein FlgG